MSRERGTSSAFRRGLVVTTTMLAAVAVFLLTVGRSQAAEKDETPAKGALPADLNLVPRDAMGFLSIRVADVWGNQDVKQFHNALGEKNPAVRRLFPSPPSVGVDLSQVERLTFIWPTATEVEIMLYLFGYPQDFATIVATTKPYDIKEVVHEMMPNHKEKDCDGKIIFTSWGSAIYPISDRAYLLGPTPIVVLLMQRLPKGAKGPLSEALALAAEKHSLTVGMNSAAVLKVLPAIVLDDKEFKPHKPILESQSVALAVDAGKELRLFGTVYCSSEKEAKNALGGTKATFIANLLLRLIHPWFKESLNKKIDFENEDLKKVMAEINTALEKATVEQKGSVVNFEAKAKVDLGTFGTALISGIREDSKHRRENNLKSLAIAMKDYGRTNGTFPPAASTDKAGNPLLSWRVLLLPSLGEDNLYKQFKLEEPWDSPNNQKLLAKMPKVFGVGDKPGTDTYYRVFLGTGAAFEGAKGTKITDFADGISNTFLVVEAETPVPWTKPDELPFDPKKVLPKVGGLDKDNFYALFANGLVKSFPKKIDKDLFKAYITRNGGEVIKK